MAASLPAPAYSPLHDRHVSAGARQVGFAGWEMPVSYTGIRAEHLAVRRCAGVFDVSHMGQIETSGPQAHALLQRLLSNDLGRLAVGGAQYSVMCLEDGGVLDDLFTYRLGEDRYLTVTNAANHEADLAWFSELGGTMDAQVTDRAGDYAMLAVQGPRARDIVGALSDAPLPPRMSVVGATVAGQDALVCGTGYTGEDGVELLIDPDGAGGVWDALLGAGAQPAGLGARDTLRLEVGYHLYGHDLSRQRDPISAGLGWCCAERTHFIGAEAVAAVRRHGPTEKLVAFSLTAPGIPRQGNLVTGGGVVTSGTLSPCLEVGIGLAYLPVAQAVPATAIEIDVRGRRRRAVVGERPLWRRPRP